jgi:RluA family pseudouridine synthase
MEILYSDRWLVVINKPAGLLSIQDGYNLDAPHVRSLLEPDFGRCWIVHRLDKETSGVLLLARTKEVHRSISILFEERKISKEYRAIANGKPPAGEFEINLPLLVNGDRRHRTIVDLEKGKPALTMVEVISSNRDLSFLSIKTRTGYTHQIRCHLAYMGFPLLGDTLYTPKVAIPQPEEKTSIKRVALHSNNVKFVHPYTNQEVTFIAPYPPDLSALLDLFK